MLALHAYQNYFGTAISLNREAINRIFTLYLGHMEARVFNMCTDDLSLNHLQTQLGVEGINL